MSMSRKAWESLTSAQKRFIRSLPKAELHAHLNGSIPFYVLKALAAEQQHNLLTSASVAAAASNPSDPSSTTNPAVLDGVGKILAASSSKSPRNAVGTTDTHTTITPSTSDNPIQLETISDFFDLFPAIYALTSTPEALGRAAEGVLSWFLDPQKNPESIDYETNDKDDDSFPQATYMELRSTPRVSHPYITSRKHYLTIVLTEIEKYPPSKAGGLIVSMDRRWGVAESEGIIREVVDITVELKNEGRRVVGIDICGDPLAGDMSFFAPYMKRAREAGLGVTVHIAETEQNTAQDSLTLLSFLPDRLGHATFLNDEARKLAMSRGCSVEICLTSNLLTKTVPSLTDHHVKFYLEDDHPICICTDDALIFKSPLPHEYALLLAHPPLGLGLSEERVNTIAKQGFMKTFARA